MKSLKKIQRKLESEFPENWLVGMSAKQLNEDYPDLIDKAIDTSFDLFCDSLLSGEYVKAGSKKTKKSLDNLEKFINEKFDEIGEDEHIQEFLESQIKRKLVDFLRRLISYYKNFAAHLSLLTTYPFHEISYSSAIDFRSKNNLESELGNKVKLFLLYLEVQVIDHYFNDEDSIIQRLSRILTLLKKSSTPSKIKTSVIEKVNFLKHKWIVRQFVYSMLDDSIRSKGYISDGEVKEHFDDEEFHSQNEILTEWAKYADSHYELFNQWKQKITKHSQQLKAKDLSKLNLKEIHTLVKFYKDVQKNPIELRGIADVLLQKEKGINEKVDKQIYRKAIIYVLNNLYSLEISIPELNEKKLSILKVEIEQLQKKFSIDNFFADKKFIDHELRKIQIAIDEREIFKNLTQESKQLKKLEPVIKRCKERMQWAYNHHSLIFQLPFKDSIVPVTYPEFKGIYYASTFVLPIPQYTNQKEFTELELQFDKLNLLTNSIKAIGAELQEITDLKEELKNNDFRSLEIIGIFTAIVTFVIASIPGFQFIDSFDKAIYFYAVLGASLSTMVLVLLLMKRGSQVLAKNWIALFSLIIVIIVGILQFYLVTKPS
ncbi:hypothetical protein MTsPCn9_26130 [Croceitalea sp. MTPC9]|uniref:hypothetical protein n=1 Tax=unclassified Croceitalea TaxID=2632280 RepID=UPI002B3D10B6|nr:hypothetical protein MTsPCn6_28400 [Croceitalea sp. MTPC6]GMN17675.1 hypothetical protein MTsPCn9_26130 [Croceitalea sp. MTPC9]